MAENRERRNRHEPPGKGGLWAAHGGNGLHRRRLPVLFRRGDRRAPDYLHRAVLQTVTRHARGPSTPRAFPKGIYTNSFRVALERDRVSALSRDALFGGTEKRQVDPPRGARALYARRRLRGRGGDILRRHEERPSPENAHRGREHGQAEPGAPGHHKETPERYLLSGDGLHVRGARLGLEYPRRPQLARCHYRRAPRDTRPQPLRSHETVDELAAATHRYHDYHERDGARVRFRQPVRPRVRHSRRKGNGRYFPPCALRAGRAGRVDRPAGVDKGKPRPRDDKAVRDPRGLCGAGEEKSRGLAGRALQGLQRPGDLRVGMALVRGHKERRDFYHAGRI